MQTAINELGAAIRKKQTNQFKLPLELLHLLHSRVDDILFE